MAAEKARVVCVTGAGGFVGSWLVKHLLSKNYTVHGTVRNPLDEKYGHLKKLEKASEKLKLFKADLLDYGSLCAAIDGCDGVFHTASPVPPSSVPDPEDWYCLSKTKAESEAWEFSKRNGIDFLSVCPTLVAGPMLQKTINASSLVLIKLLKEGYEELENRFRMIVDVRDLAEALILVYEKPEANGRYICTSHQIRSKDLVEILKKHYPDYNYPKKFIESKDKSSVTSQKLQELGWSYRPIEETLVDSVENYAQNGLLGKD
ncbi:hypothetical protein M8C21_027442 [Ambrosia artemisiifolia]|uniref:Uncharacterized protein n=1 Tax=Ambrosia artemisiifolia TaxID=4212 RepID=A0AAD5CV26_AMBAR|nr:hypothetical protein M8C21_027442 [Ambrosia artemisiifolia]